jgi:hypothetical protein
MMILTKAQVEQAFDHLAEVAESWNDCADDGDRGRGNDAVCLLLFEDGSGLLGSVFDSVENFNTQFSFEDTEQLVNYIATWCRDGKIDWVD